MRTQIARRFNVAFRIQKNNCATLRKYDKNSQTGLHFQKAYVSRRGGCRK